MISSMGNSALLYFLLAIPAVCFVSCYWTFRWTKVASTLAESIAVFMVLSAAQIWLVTLVLGYLGLLSPLTIVIGHYLIVAISLIAKHRSGLSIRQRFEAMSLQWLGLKSELNPSDGFLFVFIVGVHGFLFISAASSIPYDFDSLSYRLSRVGLWLQNSSLRQVEVIDSRMNYSAINGDLLMLWLTAPFTKSYPLVCSSQALAGILLSISTYGIASLLGFGRSLSLVSVCFIFSMPVVVGQMTTSQVDLIFSSFVSCGLFLMLSSFRGRVGFVPYSIAFAGAVGVKGSFFYFVPGLVVVFVVWSILEKIAWSSLFRQAVVLVSAFLIFGSPRYIENTLEFGNPFAPPEEMARLQSEDSTGFSVERFGLNARSYILQLFTEDSNPIGLESIFEPLADRLQNTLPEGEDNHSTKWIRRDWFNDLRGSNGSIEVSLFSSFGGISSIFAVAGCVFAFGMVWRGDRRKSFFLLSLGFGGVAYFVLFSGLYQWSPYQFRLMMLVAPIVSVFAVTSLRGISNSISSVVFPIFGAGLLSIGIGVYLSGAWSGWGNFVRAHHSLSGVIYANQARAIEDLIKPGSKVAVSLAYGSVLAPFFRNERIGQSTIVSIEKLKSYEGPESFLMDNEYDAVFTSHGLWSNPNGRVRGFAWDGMKGGRSKSNFEAYRKLFENEFSKPYVRETIIDFLPEFGGRKMEMTFALTNGIEVIEGNYHNDSEIGWILVVGELQYELAANDSLDLELAFDSNNNAIVLLFPQSNAENKLLKLPDFRIR